MLLLSPPMMALQRKFRRVLRRPIERRLAWLRRRRFGFPPWLIAAQNGVLYPLKSDTLQDASSSIQERGALFQVPARGGELRNQKPKSSKQKMGSRLTVNSIYLPKNHSQQQMRANKTIDRKCKPNFPVQNLFSWMFGYEHEIGEIESAEKISEKQRWQQQNLSCKRRQTIFFSEEISTESVLWLKNSGISVGS